MKHILIIQLERLGDLIQSTPLIQSLTYRGGTHIDLILIETYCEAIQGLPGISQIYSLEPEEVIQLNQSVASCLGSPNNPERAIALLQSLNLPSYDRIINLTHAEFGSWLAGRLTTKEIEGPYITPNGEWLFGGQWSNYLVALTEGRQYNQINLVDIYRGSDIQACPPNDTAKPYLHVS